MDTKKIVTEIYWNLVKRCKPNPEAAEAFKHEMLVDNISAKEMLKRSAAFVDLCHLGDDLLFSLALISKLSEKGIDALLVTTPLDGGISSAVAFFDNQENLFVSDIFTDIIKFTDYEEIKNKGVFSEKLRKQLFEAENSSAIDFREFTKENKWINIYPNILDFEGSFFDDFLNQGNKF